MDEKHISVNDREPLEALRGELREAQAALRSLKSIVNSSPAVVCLWRIADDWPVEFISDGIRQFGYPPEELLSGKISFRDLIIPEDMSRIEAEVAKSLEQDVDRYAQEYRITTRSGEVRWVEDRNIAIRDPSGQVTHIQGIILDITERKRMETALRDNGANLNAAQNLAHVGRWTWDLSTETL
ncbi:MAG: PAS domain-containing protein, partial [Planctomycetes bacterium]|nr:PAS domain-containing protein [Planctomycetota bacterium]